jgi:hypothetical protein
VGVLDAVGPMMAMVCPSATSSGSTPSFFRSTLPSSAICFAMAFPSGVDASVAGAAGRGLSNSPPSM